MSYSGSAGGGIGGVGPASTPQVAAVPGTKILLCKSGVKDKKPDPAGADYGEVTTKLDIPSMRASILSPIATGPTPAGVPVMITSPACRV